MPTLVNAWCKVTILAAVSAALIVGPTGFVYAQNADAGPGALDA